MGKGKGKAGRKEAKLAVKKLNQEPKIPGMPKPAQPQKKAKKIPSREKKSAINTNPPGPATYPLPMGHPKPFTKSPQHAKWPALFKKHLGLIESHIRALDRVMQSMKSDMAAMPDKERLEMELGERGNWRVICGMMDRAREVLANARLAARGILPSRALQDKKGLGVIGINFEPLGPQLEKKAADIGYDPVGKGKLGSNPEDVDDDGDSDITDSAEDSDNDESGSDAAGQNTEFVSLSIGAKVPRFPTIENNDNTNVEGSESSSTKKKNADAVEPNPYFVVDVEPTPVVLNGPLEDKKSRKQLKDEAAENRRAAREAKKAEYMASKAATDAQPKEHSPQTEVDFTALEAKLQAEIAAAKPEPEVDFTALEAKLQAEIAAGTKAQEEAEKKSKKKRRRSSDGTNEVAEKKARTDKVEKKEKKRKLENSADGEDSPGKKAKKEKKEKKRKADDSAEAEELEEGAVKKRKHKGAA